jgi:hypothetical protein
MVKLLFVYIKMNFFVVQKLFKTSLNSVVLISSFKLLVSSFIGFGSQKKATSMFMHFLKLAFASAFTQPQAVFLSVKNGFTLFTQHLLLLLNIFNNRKTITRSV